MCGICGVVTTRDSWSTERLEQTVLSMAETLRHRGPDDEGCWSDARSGIALGFRRLAIIDLSPEARQPMGSSSGRFTMVFNGEIYNYREIGKTLQARGIRFRGTSDTEVLLAAFDTWGLPKTLDRVTGMFAIALWDQQTRELHLIRDRLGIKPFFYAWRPGVVSFGSELKALKSERGFVGAIDRDALTSYFRHLYVPAPRTIFRNTWKLLPGHVLTIRDPAEPPPAPQAFWSLVTRVRGSRDGRFSADRPERALEATERVLRTAVSDRMYADVPLGAFLSGGIDSSLVVALMQETASKPVRTFSIAFREEEYNEAAFAKEVARHLGTEHTEFTLTADDALEVIPRLAETFDEPFASPSAIPNLLLCQTARRHVTVALSGAGGDEIFCGYNRYTHGAKLVRRLAGMPGSARRMLAVATGPRMQRSLDRLNRSLRPLLPASRRQRLVSQKIKKIHRMAAFETPFGMYRSLVSAWNDPALLVRGGYEAAGAMEVALMGESMPKTWLERFMLVDQLTYLPDDQLAKLDRVSMAVSLEARVPLLDHRVVEHAWKLPPTLKSRGATGKWILRELLYRRVPRHLIDRPKMGLSVPIASWLRGPLRPWAEELLDERSLRAGGVLEAAPIRSAWDSFQRDGRADALDLWTVLMFQAWRQRWLD